MKPPLPPFSLETATAKVQAAEDAWNTRDPESIALAYSIDTRWRNRSDFLEGREAVAQYLQGKWQRELDYRLKKTLWSFTGNHIAVKFAYEYHNADGQWFRAYGNELWEFADDGLMQVREASINDLSISESDRKFRWNRSSQTARTMKTTDRAFRTVGPWALQTSGFPLIDPDPPRPSPEALRQKQTNSHHQNYGTKFLHLRLHRQR